LLLVFIATVMTVHAWAFEGRRDPFLAKDNNLTTEWPPQLGRQMDFQRLTEPNFLIWK
jgi:hypothetical protein